MRVLNIYQATFLIRLEAVASRAIIAMYKNGER
jgi:hypothetical protein